MFDIGFSELLVLAVVTLVVVGPERLPKVARTLGHLMGRFQRYVSDVKSDIDRELRLEEMKKLREEVEMQARKIETQISSEARGVEGQLTAPVAEVEALAREGGDAPKALLESLAAPASGAATAVPGGDAVPPAAPVIAAPADTAVAGTAPAQRNP